MNWKQNQLSNYILVLLKSNFEKFLLYHKNKANFSFILRQWKFNIHTQNSVNIVLVKTFLNSKKSQRF